MSEVYKKLTGKVNGVGVYSQLWRASDHLLLVRSSGFTESYRRFYFRDIQKIVVMHTDRRTLFAIIVIGMAAILGAAAYFASSGEPLAVGLVLVPCGILFAFNQIKGRGCRVTLVTAVQSEVISALVRLPSTRRILRLLDPDIREAQANLGSQPTPPPTDAEPSFPRSDGPPPLPIT